VRAKILNTSVTVSPESKKARVQYRSEGKKLDYFGKTAPSSSRKQASNTEAGAKSSNTSVNQRLQTQESKSEIPKWEQKA